MLSLPATKRPINMLQLRKEIHICHSGPPRPFQGLKQTPGLPRLSIQVVVAFPKRAVGKQAGEGRGESVLHCFA